jgi:hypothetical protein
MFSKYFILPVVVSKNCIHIPKQKVIRGHQRTMIHSCMKNYGCFSREPRLVENSAKIEQSQVSVLPVNEKNMLQF